MDWNEDDEFRKQWEEVRREGKNVLKKDRDALHIGAMQRAKVPELVASQLAIEGKERSKKRKRKGGRMRNQLVEDMEEVVKRRAQVKKRLMYCGKGLTQQLRWKCWKNKLEDSKREASRGKGELSEDGPKSQETSAPKLV